MSPPRSVSAREIVGKRITAFENPTARARNYGNTKYHPDPRIWLDDGSCLYFVVEETDHDEYGVFVGRAIPGGLRLMAASPAAAARVSAVLTKPKRQAHRAVP